MQAVHLKDLPRGEFFKRKESSNTVHIRAEYCRDVKKFQCINTEDVLGNGIQLKGSTVVFVGFTY